MNAKLKICGMRDSANIAEVAALQPDYIGFIFYEKSPRYVGEDFEIPAIDSLIKKVGVFVNPDAEYITSKIERYKLDLIQLHGFESPDQCEKFRSKGVEVVKAFSIDEDFDFTGLKSYADHVDYFLFDTKGKYFGGNAKVFDWTLLNQYSLKTPFFLSGGISVENIENLADLKKFNIHVIDVNSGVEILPALKDIHKIKELKRVLDLL